MATKPFHCHDLSDRICTNPHCGKRLKKNLVTKHGDPEGKKPLYCWRCKQAYERRQRRKSAESAA